MPVNRVEPVGLVCNVAQMRGCHDAETNRTQRHRNTPLTSLCAVSLYSMKPRWAATFIGITDQEPLSASAELLATKLRLKKVHLQHRRQSVVGGISMMVVGFIQYEMSRST